MFSVVSKLFNYFSYENERKESEKKLEAVLLELDDEERKEKSVGVPTTVAPKKEEIKEKHCFRKQGVITTVQSDHGIIDKTLLYDSSAARNVADLRVGFLVQYLGYQAPDSDYVKVIRIERILNDYWDVNANDEVQPLDDAAVVLEDPEFFSTHQRSFLGQVIGRNDNFIKVDTDYDKIDIDLDTVTIDYTLQVGDRVYLTCNVQTDKDFVDSTGEILEVVSIHAARTKKIMGTVTTVCVDESWGLVNNEFFFSFDVLPSNYVPLRDDRVSAQIVESERGKYIWRCASVHLNDRPTEKKLNLDPDDNLFQNKGGVVVTDNLNFNFQKLHEQKCGEIVMKNQSDEVRTVKKVCFLGKKSQSQLNVVEPKLTEQFSLNPGESKVFQLIARAKMFGYSKEVILFTFEKFKIAREIEIEVGESDGGNKIDSRKKTQRVKKNGYHRRDYSYAHQVWSKRSSFIPGVHGFEKPKFIANRIGLFEVPERLRNSVLSSKNITEMSEIVEDFYPCLTESLAYQNYCIRFQTLLHLEEIEYFLQIRQYDRDRAHFTRDTEFLSLQIDNLSEKRPSLMLGDSIRVTNPWSDSADNRCYEGIIHKVLFDRILLKFNQGFQQKYNGEDYRIEFYFSRFSFRKQHYALKKAYHQMGPNFLFPSKIYLQEKPQLEVSLTEKYDLVIKDETKEVKWFNESLNDVQKKAIKNILRGEARPLPYVIFGPPGTGKTLTLIELILQLVTLLPDSRLLVGTPSNSSADLIATRLIGCKALRPGDFVRLVSQNVIEKELIPDHLKPYCATVDIAMEGTSRDGGMGLRMESDDNLPMHRVTGFLLALVHLVWHRPNQLIVTESGLKLKCQLKHMGRHRITIGTCIALGSLMQMGFAKDHFTHVIIDESGQCIESENMIPISLVDQHSGQVILAGDPQQLGPIILNKYAVEKGLEISFLERILNRMPYRKDVERFPDCGYDPRLVTKLIYNYRALPSILKLYNDLFYDSELRPMIDEETSQEIKTLQSLSSILPAGDNRPSNQAVFFYGIRGENKQESDSPSWYNPAEAKSIFLFVLKLYKKNISAKNIGIITPYQKQVKAIRNIFIEADIMLPKIGSVEEFQGQERDIILISTVRSRKSLIQIDVLHSLGFVRSDKRLNVAISRARALLVVFGNPHLLRLDKNWERLIRYCIANDAYTGCDLPSEML